MSRTKDIDNIVYSFIGLRRGLVKDIHSLHGMLPHAQGEALFCVYHNGELTASELASKLDVTAGAAAQLVESLATAGLLNRCNNKDDRRVIDLTVSEHGKLLLQKTKKAKRQKLDQILEPLNDEEVQTLAQLLNKISAKKEKLIER